MATTNNQRCPKCYGGGRQVVPQPPAATKVWPKGALPTPPLRPEEPCSVCGGSGSCTAEAAALFHAERNYAIAMQQYRAAEQALITARRVLDEAQANLAQPQPCRHYSCQPGPRMPVGNGPGIGTQVCIDCGMWTTNGTRWEQGPVPSAG